ncbi:hypothetical protein JJ691_33400 [Kutzneria sp. CA-103260]|nr:hypothetical protein JJ691_33400 [Kutzneria sp. CA-103260]
MRVLREQLSQTSIDPGAEIGADAYDALFGEGRTMT